MTQPAEILAFWLEEVGPKGWYEQSDALDETIRQRFMRTWEDACAGKHARWLTCPSGALAYIILMDQFPRNMFREDGRAFSSDRNALAAAKSAIEKGWDMRIEEPARQFFYLPLMHSENLCDQDRSVRLICKRMPENRESNLLHARAHREVIRRFGRFPHRNPALARSTTDLEKAYMRAGGYGAMVRNLQAEAKAA